jgi:hypothetical protein
VQQVFRLRHTALIPKPAAVRPVPTAQRSAWWESTIAPIEIGAWLRAFCGSVENQQHPCGRLVVAIPPASSRGNARSLEG